MTLLMEKGKIDQSLFKQLHSKVNFDKVTSLNGKPSVEAEGISKNASDSVSESANNLHDTVILADSPNLYKQKGEFVANLGYFIIPRSITSDPRYKSAPLKYQKVLLIIFEHVAFAETTHAIGCEIININIGQYCISIRGLMDLCNEGVKHSSDKISKNCVDRAIAYFEKCQFVGQEVRHGKSILTITVPEFYERNKNTSGTASGTKVGQKWDTKEEYKEDKNIKDNTDVLSMEADAPKPPKKTKKPQKILQDEKPKRDELVHTSDIEHAELVKAHGEDKVKQAYKILSEWKKSKAEVDPECLGKHTDAGRIKKWAMQEVYKRNGNKNIIKTTEKEEVKAVKVDKEELERRSQNNIFREMFIKEGRIKDA